MERPALDRRERVADQPLEPAQRRAELDRGRARRARAAARSARSARSAPSVRARDAGSRTRPPRRRPRAPARRWGSRARSATRPASHGASAAARAASTSPRTPPSTTSPPAANVHRPTAERAPRPAVRAIARGSGDRPASVDSAAVTASASFVPEPRPTCAGIASSTRTRAPALLAERVAASLRHGQRALAVRALDGELVARARLHDHGRPAHRHPEPAEPARSRRPRRRACPCAGARAPRRGPPSSVPDRGAHVRQDAVHRRPLARAGRLVHEDRQATELGADLLRGQPAHPRGEDRGLEDRVTGAVEADELAPAPLATTRVVTRARGPVASIASTATSRHEQASASTAPSTATAGRVGGCGSPSAACVNTRMSSVRFTTAAPCRLEVAKRAGGSGRA